MVAFEKEGEDGVLKFANEKLISMMYEDGATPQMIRFSDYAKWKKTVVCIIILLRATSWYLLFAVFFLRNFLFSARTSIITEEISRFVHWHPLDNGTPKLQNIGHKCV